MLLPRIGTLLFNVLLVLLSLKNQVKKAEKSHFNMVELE